MAAARLRGLNVTHINHLMQQDSNRLADALGLANVDAATIRRWQAECRLVCRVPQLRGFDARVLVGCGITTPAQLASIHPVDLLQEVEEFLTTDRGQRILLSGSSHELSRITSWIAAANSSSDRDFAALGRGRDSRGRVYVREHHASVGAATIADSTTMTNPGTLSIATVTSTKTVRMERLPRGAAGSTSSSHYPHDEPAGCRLQCW